MAAQALPQVQRHHRQHSRPVMRRGLYVARTVPDQSCDHTPSREPVAPASPLQNSLSASPHQHTLPSAEKRTSLQPCGYLS